jgi:predicted HNH restriction endonuclease
MTETWNDFTYRLIVDFCTKRGNRTFSLKDFQETYQEEIKAFRPATAKTPDATVRRELQALRNKGIITFHDKNGNAGHYTLRKPVILEDELDSTLNADMLNEDAAIFTHENKNDSKLIKREYLIESFARNKGWVKAAKDTFGYYCIHPECANSFLKEDGIPYIEVHHIIPLHDNGEDGIWNLAVVCAHHHKMAHFSSHITQKELQKLFLSIVEKKLVRMNY